MQPVQIASNIFWVGVNDRKTELFEGLWHIKESGVSYNAYLVKGSEHRVTAGDAPAVIPDDTEPWQNPDDE